MINSSANNEKIVFSLASLGMFLSTLDSGIMNVALPTLQAEFNVPVTTISWAILSYLLTLSSTILIFGKLSDSYGRVKIYLIGMIIFGLSSLLCGLSINVAFIIISRSFQGIGAAMLQATSIALITTLITHDKREKSLGNLGVIMSLGPILGPTIGGLLLSSVGWRWIFWINIPLTIIGIIGSTRLKDIIYNKALPATLFLNLLLAFGMLCILLFLTLWPTATHHLKQYLLVLLISGLIVFLLFFLQQKHAPHPVIPIAATHNIVSVLYLYCTFAFGAAIAMVLVVPPFFLEKITKLLPWQVGLVALFAPLGIVMTARISGIYLHKTNFDRFMLTGLFIMLFSLLIFTYVNESWGYIIFSFLLLIFGLGGGLFQPANIAAIMNSVEEPQHGAIASFNRMVHNFANALGVSIASISLGSAKLDHSTFIINIQHSWLIAFSFIFTAFFAAVICKIKAK